jgi:hypothetical protein
MGTSRNAETIVLIVRCVLRSNSAIQKMYDFYLVTKLILSYSPPYQGNVIELRKKLSSECHPVNVTEPSNASSA